MAVASLRAWSWSPPYLHPILGLYHSDDTTACLSMWRIAWVASSEITKYIGYALHNVRLEGNRWQPVQLPSERALAVVKRSQET